jgi:hypothetical protein
MIVIYKLFIIKQLGIITDILNYITKLWLVEETVVIEPPSLEEWKRDKVFHCNPIGDKKNRHILVKHNIMYIECYYFSDCGTHYLKTNIKINGHYIDPIIYQ